MTASILLVKRVAFVAALTPALGLAYGAYAGDLTANPVEYLIRETGYWALALLTISLAVTPLRRISGWNEVIKLRRMLGLFAFFYAVLHLATWVGLLSFFDVATMIEDVLERPFITVGMATFLILLALALTSSAGAIRRMGRRWQQLHRLVYLAAVGAVVHFWWLVKADISEPARWGVAVVFVLAFRVWWQFRAARARAR